MHRWTQQDISEWAVAQFGEAEDATDLIDRASQEFDELFTAAYGTKQNIASYADVAEEIADVVIVLSQYLQRVGYDLQTEIDKKMEINSRRTWIKTANGVGQHV